MRNKGQQPLIKVFADSVSRKLGVCMFTLLLILLGSVYILAIFVVPEVFQTLEPGKDCFYSGPTGNIGGQPIGCDVLALAKGKVWEGHFTEMNVTNVFLAIEGVGIRKQSGIEDGSIIRVLRRDILPDRDSTAESLPQFGIQKVQSDQPGQNDSLLRTGRADMRFKNLRILPWHCF